MTRVIPSITFTTDFRRDLSPETSKPQIHHKPPKTRQMYIAKWKQYNANNKAQSATTTPTKGATGRPKAEYYKVVKPMAVLSFSFVIWSVTWGYDSR